jgi:hypothetical protein
MTEANKELVHRHFEEIGWHFTRMGLRTFLIGVGFRNRSGAIEVVGLSPPERYLVVDSELKGIAVLRSID